MTVLAYTCMHPLQILISIAPQLTIAHSAYIIILCMGSVFTLADSTLMVVSGLTSSKKIGMGSLFGF